jgi:hypothetical protein
MCGIIFKKNNTNFFFLDLQEGLPGKASSPPKANIRLF